MAILWSSIALVLIELILPALPVILLTEVIFKAFLVIVLKFSALIFLLLRFAKIKIMWIFLTRLILKLDGHLCYLRGQRFKQIFYKLLSLILEEHVEVFKYQSSCEVTLNTDCHAIFEHFRLRLCAHKLLVFVLK